MCILHIVKDTPDSKLYEKWSHCEKNKVEGSFGSYDANETALVGLTLLEAVLHPFLGVFSK